MPEGVITFVFDVLLGVCRCFVLLAAVSFHLLSFPPHCFRCLAAGRLCGRHIIALSGLAIKAPTPARSFRAALNNPKPKLSNVTLNLSYKRRTYTCGRADGRHSCSEAPPDALAS